MTRSASFLGFALAAPLAFAGLASAEPVSYGSLAHHPELPGVLFLTGEIKVNDSFELRRAMREHKVDLVVTASLGGNLYEGLQIASILHDNRIGTYVPEGASCESSCANVFLGGVNRLVVGGLGVHQFFRGGPSADTTALQSETTARTQYTTADIIGIMNQFDTPPFVYERMFGTTNIYYFKGAEKSQLNRGLNDAAFISRVSETDAFLTQKPETLHRSATHPVRMAPSQPAPLAPSMEVAARNLMMSINNDWSLPNNQALSRLSGYYGSRVDFYGKRISRDDVMAEKAKFAMRWPIRDYRVEPESIDISCDRDQCFVDAIISWSAASSERRAKASGRSTWKLVVVPRDDGLKIIGESGKTLQRN